MVCTVSLMSEAAWALSKVTTVTSDEFDSIEPMFDSYKDYTNGRLTITKNSNGFISRYKSEQFNVEKHREMVLKTSKTTRGIQLRTC